jgi:integrase
MSEAHSTPKPRKAKADAKPKKPHKDFPLFAHNNGQWAKKVRQRMYFFGKWDNPQAAMKKWIAQKDDLLAGRTPRAHDPGELTVERLCNLFLDSRQRLVDTGELSPGTVADYLADSKIVVKVLGRSTAVEQLRPDDFSKLRSTFAKGVNIKTLEGCIARVRAIFNYADKNGMLERSLNKLWGTEFNKPGKTALDKHRNKTVRMFEPAEVLQLIKSANPQVAAQILLGINCAMGPTDLAKLRFDHLNGEWLNVPRSKTGIMRRCWLWPETRKAIQDAVAARPEPKDPVLSEIVFITKYGRDWGHQGALSSEIRKLLNACEISGKGKTFYTLRHVFQTIADETKDFVAVSSCMGHATGSISDHYREKIGDERLRAVSLHVRDWLFGGRMMQA